MILGLHFHLPRHLLRHRRRLEAGEFGEVLVADAGTAQHLQQIGVLAQGLAQQIRRCLLRQLAGRDPGGGQPLPLFLDGVALLAEEPPAGLVHQPQLAAGFGQAQIRVVLPQQQAVFGPAGEHAVGFRGPAGDQVVYQHADIRLVAAGTPRLSLFDPQGGVDARHQPLTRRFLIASGAVDLPGEKHALYALCLQPRTQIAGVEEVVFDGVARPGDAGMLKTLDGARQFALRGVGQAGGNAVGIHLRGGQAFRLHEDLMGRLVRKPDHLVLYRGAIARPDALYAAVEHRRVAQGGADDVVGARVGVGNMAWRLARALLRGAEERERRRRIVPRLRGQPAVIDGAAVQARRGAGLQPPGPERQFAQPLRQGVRRRVAGPSALVVALPHMQPTRQKSPHREDHAGGAKADAQLRPHAANRAALDDQVLHGLLKQIQVFRPLQQGANDAFVQGAVDLRPGGAHRRPPAGVQDAELDPAPVRRQPHGAAQGVYLLDQVPLANAAYGGVAGHLPQGVHAVGQQQNAGAKPGARQGRLGPSMTAANDDDLVFLPVVAHNRPGIVAHRPRKIKTRGPGPVYNGVHE